MNQEIIKRGGYQERVVAATLLSKGGCNEEYDNYLCSVFFDFFRFVFFVLNFRVFSRFFEIFYSFTQAGTDFRKFSSSEYNEDNYKNNEGTTAKIVDFQYNDDGDYILHITSPT